MCLQYIKLKTKNRQGLRYAYVPCGKCADCRKEQHKAWQFRLNSEFFDLKNKGWNVAFCTLTYDEDSLPKIPEVCFKDVSQYRDIPCFDRRSVREWIDNIRQYCKYHYRFVDGDNIRYFIASEYGSNTHRPHYHAILAWPCVSKSGQPGPSYEKMHALCSHYWTGGFLFPRHYLGDGDCLSFEVVGDPTKCLGYVSKYAAKDIDYVDEIRDVELYDNVRHYVEGTDERAYARVYQNCKPFHIQSVSLGFEPIRRMSDEEKREVFVNGMSFVGDGNVYKVPVYIKNKILFDNYYVFDALTGKRLVKRNASQFFEKYGREIFEEKAKFYHKYVCETNTDWLLSNGVDHDIACTFGDCLDKLKSIVDSYYDDSLYGNNMMGKMYMAYQNIKVSECYDQDLYDQWMMRYHRPEENAYRVKDLSLYSSVGLFYLHRYWNAVDMLNSYVGVTHLDEREAEERLSKRILDFFKKVL